MITGIIPQIIMRTGRVLPNFFEYPVRYTYGTCDAGYTSCPGRVVDILEASGAFDPGSNPGRGVLFSG
jgi:hypothetical protein